MLKDTLKREVPLDRPLSKRIHASACKVIPGGVNSPVRSFPGLDQTPLIAEWGQKDIVCDPDGYQYIDYCGSWGALILGHAHPQVVAAAEKRIRLGSTFGIATQAEERLAKKICSLVPSVEKIRFVSSGTEATMSAIRLARGVTGRHLILKFAGHYHGHADAFLIQAGSGVVNLSATSSSAGVPPECIKNTLCLPFNDFAAVREIFRKHSSEIAAVILEPIACNMGVVPPAPGFLETLREETARSGAILIFDEVITGFRVGLQGAQGLFGIVPDLTCFGKIIGGGFPAAAFGGKREIMENLAPLGPVYQAGTLSGNPVAMEAGYQTLTLLETPGFYQRLQEKTDLLLHPVREIIAKGKFPLCLQEVGSMFTLFFGCHSVQNFEEAKEADLSLFKSFFQHLFQHGIYISPAQHEGNFISSAHEEEHLQETSQAIIDFLFLS